MGRAKRLEEDRVGELINKCRAQPKALASTSTHTSHTGISKTPESPDHATGCASRAEAEKALATYIAIKERTGYAADPVSITIDEILPVYADQYAINTAALLLIGYAIEALLPFWGALKAAGVKGATCRRDAKTRRTTKGCPQGESRPVAPATVRRERNTLQGALNYCHRKEILMSAPVVTSPAPTNARQRYLTRDDAARLAWDAYPGRRSHRALPPDRSLHGNTQDGDPWDGVRGKHCCRLVRP